MAKHDSTLKSQLEMASQLNNFAMSLFQGIGKSSGACQNVLVSPVSVAAVLSMVHVGARGNTALQLKQALGFTKIPEEEINAAVGNLITSMKGDDNFVLKVANLVYIEEQLQVKKKFQKSLENHFEAFAERANFGDPQTRVKINSYVEEFTNKKIKDLLSEDVFDDHTKMVLINAVYFKGDWLEPFDRELTKTKPFYLCSAKKKVDCRMMCVEDIFRTGKIASLDARFVEIPYKGERLSMVVILPNKIDGLSKVEENLSSSVLDQMEKKTNRKMLSVELPKFKIETTMKEELSNVLIEMGVEDLFTSGADLSGVSEGVSGSSELFLSSIVQKCFIEVDEKGTEAAAATGGGLTASCVPPPVPSFKVDHPAVFLLKDNVTKLVLFVGRLANPAEK